MKNRDKKTDTFIERHKQAEDALKDSQKRYRNLVDNALVGIYQTNLKGDILYVNQALAHMLEFESPEELQRETAPVRYKNPEDREVFIDILKKTRNITNYEVAILTKTGKAKNILLSAVLEEDKLSGMAMDITDRKNMEEVLKFKTAELKRSNKDLDYFASVVSHDLKEPLLSIGGYAQILGEKYKDRLDNKAVQYIDRIIAGTLRMEQLISDLLAYSRVSTQASAFSSVDWNVILTKVRANLRQAIRKSDALITADPLPAIPGDETQCIQLIQNLVGNAIKYRGAETPRIHISARRVEKLSHEIPQLESKQGWLFSVSDNGMSIPAEDTERIFELFHRLSTSGDQAGTGIGLAICKKIVERHGGRIWVESEPGRGSTFYFSLP